MRSASTIAWGTFLILASATLVIVLAAGSRAPLWMVGAWLLLALAISLVVGAMIPAGDPREVTAPTARTPAAPDYTGPNGIDPAITGEPREEQEPPGRDAPGAPQ
ncbi:hypothetical protein ACT3TZ_07705 [Brachybacterium sp. AOP25-B2-12]|uniref:hypothetical protein n=1 Tax=Brachybacterium sp. AOP25-B2-12 TaxID=3457710 RepID=UPI00403412FE